MASSGLEGSGPAFLDSGEIGIYTQYLGRSGSTEKNLVGHPYRMSKN